MIFRAQNRHFEPDIAKHAGILTLSPPPRVRAASYWGMVADRCHVAQEAPGCLPHLVVAAPSLENLRGDNAELPLNRYVMLLLLRAVLSPDHRRSTKNCSSHINGQRPYAQPRARPPQRPPKARQNHGNKTGNGHRDINFSHGNGHGHGYGCDNGNDNGQDHGHGHNDAQPRTSGVGVD